MQLPSDSVERINALIIERCNDGSLDSLTRVVSAIKAEIQAEYNQNHATLTTLLTELATARMVPEDKAVCEATQLVYSVQEQV